MAAATPTPRRRSPDSYDLETPDEKPPSRLMRVPTDTYELIQKWAEKERRHMNQQLAVMVEEWDQAERAKAREAKRGTKSA